jgi:hypothetical protein
MLRQQIENVLLWKVPDIAIVIESTLTSNLVLHGWIDISGLIAKRNLSNQTIGACNQSCFDSKSKKNCQILRLWLNQP